MENSELEGFIDAVRERSDIYEVVSRYVPLNLKGGRFWACCPFHEEKTPSFTIQPDKGIFYCFGCHTGGNVFKFISLMERITYFEAVKLQAERLGMELPTRKKTAEEIKFEHEKDALLKITSLTREFYHSCLMNSGGGEQGRKYLAARGISEKVIKEFRLGCAPNEWDALTKKIAARGFSDKQLLSAGIAVERKNGNGVYDRLRGRVIIPISDISGKVVAFGGRILVDDENQPKYLNTPETEIFSKGKLLFGLDKSNRAIVSANTAIVVEGYMDAISLFSAGIENVVASLGTAFTEDHAKILARYARRIIFCYDSDDAGQRATVRALPMMKNTGAEVFVLIIPDGKDPDEFIRKHGKDAFNELLKNVTPVIDFLFQYKIDHIDYSTLRGKMQVLNEMLPLFLEVKNKLAIEDYFKKFSSKLILDERLIIKEWLKVKPLSTPNFKAAPKIQPLETSLISQAGGTIIKTIWQNTDLVNYVNAAVPKENFIGVHKEIINYIEKCYDEGRTPDAVNSELSPEAVLEISRILSNVESPEKQMSAFQDSVKIMRRVKFDQDYKKAVQEVEKISNTGDIQAESEKLLSLVQIQKQFAEI